MNTLTYQGILSEPPNRKSRRIQMRQIGFELKIKVREQPPSQKTALGEAHGFTGADDDVVKYADLNELHCRL